jgi:protein-disulfide isomerase
MTKGFSVLIALCLLAFGTIFFLKKDSTTTNTANGQSTQHRIGANKKKVEFIEYGDFSCTFCGQFYGIGKQLKAKYGDDIVFQFKHYPLIDAHPNAVAASRAAESASKQGKFWEMHDLLYENQREWNPSAGESTKDPIPFLEKYAQSLGLDMVKYKADFVDPATVAIINADKADGTKARISGTPGIVINGVKDDYRMSLDYFVTRIDAEIAKQVPSASPSASAAPQEASQGLTPGTIQSPTPAQ